MGKPVFLRTREKIVEGKKLRVPLLSEMTGDLSRCLLRGRNDDSRILLEGPGE